MLVQQFELNNNSSTNTMLEIQTGRPTTRGSTMTFATTRAAGWVSTGMVAGWSIDNEISCNLDTSMILTPQPNSLIKNKTFSSTS